MSGYKFKSNSGEVLRTARGMINMIQGRMAMDIERSAKTDSGMPVLTGGMKSEVRSFMNGHNKWRVIAGKEYSAVQEAGIRLSGKGAPTRPFANYSTAGTGPGWFARAIDGIVKNRDSYVQEARRAFGL